MEENKIKLISFTITLCFLISTMSACSTVSASKTVNVQPAASSTVNAVSQSSTVSVKPTSASAVSAVAGVVPKTFKAKVITKIVDLDKYSIYVPDSWIVSQDNEDFYVNTKTGQKWIGYFVHYKYVGVGDLLGTDLQILKQKEIAGMKQKTIQVLVKRFNCPSERAAGNNSVKYELHTVFISRNGKYASDFFVQSEKTNEKISDTDEKAILQKIYENTGLNDEMVQEILHSYSET